MKPSNLSIVIASFLLATTAAMAQTTVKKPETGDGPNPVIQRQDTTVAPNSRAAVKSEIGQSTGPKETGDGPRSVKPDTTVGNNTRADVKADAGTPKTKVESGDGPRANSTSANDSRNQAMRTERQKKAKAKRDAKMSSKEKPAVTAQ